MGSPSSLLLIARGLRARGRGRQQLDRPPMMPVHRVHQVPWLQVFMSVRRGGRAGSWFSCYRWAPGGQWQGGQRRRPARPGLGTNVAVEEHMNSTAPTWCLSPRLAPRAAQAKGGICGPLRRGAHGSCLFPHLRPERWLRDGADGR